MPTYEDLLTWNKTVIAEFGANGAVVSQPDFPILLLTTTGARTGRRRTAPVAYGVDDGRVFIVASNAGAPANTAR